MNEISTWNFYLAVVILCSLSIFDNLKSNTSIIENTFPSIFRKLLTLIQNSNCRIFYQRQVVAGLTTRTREEHPISKLLQNNIYQTMKQQSGFAAIVRCKHNNSLTIN